MLLVLLPALTVWKVWSSSVWLPLSYSSTERGLLLTGGVQIFFKIFFLSVFWVRKSSFGLPCRKGMQSHG